MLHRDRFLLHQDRGDGCCSRFILRFQFDFEFDRIPQILRSELILQFHSFCWELGPTVSFAGGLPSILQRDREDRITFTGLVAGLHFKLLVHLLWDKGLQRIKLQKDLLSCCSPFQVFQRIKNVNYEEIIEEFASKNARSRFR